jgi:phosphomannomutase
VRENGADLGVAWDGDFDRCFLFDEKAEFIEGYYIVGLLAEVFLRKQPGAKIMYDPRLTWNTQEVVDAAGGTAVRCKSGHAFMKECMRANEVLYGGEMSAHHYFKDFSYCDSGMIPWLLVAELLCTTGKNLSELVAERMEKFPCSGEINRKVEDSAAVLAAIEAKYADGGQVDKLDGLSIDYADWRFNVRVSNTEPVMRLNVETRGDKKLLAEKTAELLAMIGGEEA